MCARIWPFGINSKTNGTIKTQIFNLFSDAARVGFTGLRRKNAVIGGTTKYMSAEISATETESRSKGTPKIARNFGFAKDRKRKPSTKGNRAEKKDAKNICQKSYNT
jgi:hypothetical protein